MKLPKLITIVLLLFSVALPTALLLRMWMAWPDRTASKLMESMRASDVDELNRMMRGGSRWGIEDREIGLMLPDDSTITSNTIRLSSARWCERLSTERSSNRRLREYIERLYQEEQ